MHSNKVELISWHNGDLGIARAAWVSTQSDVNKKTDKQIRDLLVNKLWNNGSGKPHKTPFERGIVEFNILVEQASHIQTIKHRLANVNGESARYMELKSDNYYLPKDFKGIEPSYDTRTSLGYEDFKDWYSILEDFTKHSNELYHACLKDTEEKLGRKRAKESARFFKTMNSQINLSVMMNMSCFYNFVTLRHDEAAQREISWVAEEMVKVVKNIEGNPFKHTMEAFGF